jgi:hypothetical protein
MLGPANGDRLRGREASQDGGVLVRVTSPAWVTAAILVASGGAALAHHSYSIFDTSLPTGIEGTVVEFKFTNPHSIMMVKAKDKDGRIVTWTLEGASPTVLVRQGWSARTLKPGDQVSLTIWPVRGGGVSGMWVPQWVHFRDGRSVAAGQ